MNPTGEKKNRNSCWEKVPGGYLLVKSQKISYGTSPS